MNTRNLKLLRDFILKSTTFDQQRFSHPCGSPGCIAGHATALAGWTFIRETSCRNAQGEMSYAFITARQFLGLDNEQAKDMFLTFVVVGGYNVGKWRAVRMLDWAINHGTVRWY